MREGSVGGVGSVGGNPKKYKGVLKIGFGIRSRSSVIGTATIIIYYHVDILLKFAKKNRTINCSS